MIHDPCIVPQLRNKKRERDDWFLVRMGCFKGDGDTDDADSALGFEDDEAADYQDRVDEAMKQARDRGDDTDEIEDFFDRTEVREPILSPADRGQRAPIDTPRIQGIREFSPTPFPDSDTPGGPPSVPDPEPTPGKKLADGRLFQDQRTYDRGLADSIGRTPRIDREGRLGPGALFGDPATDIFDSDLIEQSRQAAQAQGMTQYNPAQQQIQAARGPREEVYNVAAPERTFPSPYEQFIGAPNIQTSQGRAPEQTDMRSFRTGLPSSVEVLGAKVPTGIGVLEGVVNAVADPKGTLEQALYNQGAKSIKNINTGKNIEDTGNEAGLEVITAGDRTAAYDPRSNIVYDTNPFDFSDINPEIQELYDKKRQRDEQDRGSRGGDDPIIPPLIPEDPLAQDQAPEPVGGQNVITGANYQPREPVQFAYTGLPTLAPVSLQPTFQAQQQFTPTFGLDALRRS